MPKAAAISDLSSLPVILTLKEIAGIYRLSALTIRRALQAGTFKPRPWDRYPYRWRREDIVADLKTPRTEKPRRPHGFSATRRPVKAGIDAPASTRSAR